MKRFSLLVILLLTSPVTAEPKTLKDARERWLHGNYEEARDIYEKLRNDPKEGTAAAIGQSQALQSLGDYDSALTTLEIAAKQAKPPAELLARQAELLYFLGRRAEALKAAEAALERKEDNFLARWVRASIYQDRGDIDKADKEYRWFLRTYNDRQGTAQEVKAPDDLLLVGLAGTENVRLNIRKDNSLAEQYTFVLNDIYGDIIKETKDYWPAEYQSGMLLLEKYNRGEAAGAFNNALKINPNAAEVYVGRGLAALQKLEIKEAEEAANKALAINPKLPDALRFRADVYLAEGDLDKAVKELERARAINPVSEETLGRLAACHYLLKKTDEFNKLVAQVEKEDSKPGIFYLLLAEQLEQRRRFDDAEKFYKKASELRPYLTSAQNALGLLYMRMGREAEAKKILDPAFDADPFNVRVSNTLKVLKHLDKYKTIKTDHFEIRYDPKNDEVLAHFLSVYLEDIYKDLAEKFNHPVKWPILIEVFNKHEMFSGRVVALPDLHTIGACTGKMFAMVSPRATDLNRKFNWGRVVRHEMVHIFNLDQTNFLVPTWFTEGLAVENEGFPRPPEWNELLLERVPSGKIKNLDTIDMGFMKPDSRAEWALSYCQAQLYVQYIKSKFGADSIGKLLTDFHDGKGAEEALTHVCKVDKATFEKGYKEYLEQTVQGIRGKPADKNATASLQELKDAHEKNPDDVAVAGELAVRLLRHGDRADARKLADEVLAKKKNQPRASFVKAKLLDAAGDTKESIALLEAAVDDKDPDPLVVGELARQYFNGKEPAKAVKMYELGHKAEPYEKKWLEGLAKSYADAGDKAKQIDILKELVPLDADDLANRRRLAQLLTAAGNPAEAEKYARQGLEIDVLDKETQDALFEALEAQKKTTELERMKKLLTEK